jgi:hypothetical protein
MCLDHLTDEQLPNLQHKRVGWVVIPGKGPRICTSWRGKERYFRNKWYKAKSPEITTWRGSLYEAGFHIWATLDGAKAWKISGYRETIVKVRFRKVIHIGIQKDHLVIIARERMILGPEYDQN